MFSPLGNTKRILVPAGIAASLELALTVGPIPERLILQYIGISDVNEIVECVLVQKLDVVLGVHAIASRFSTPMSCHMTTLALERMNAEVLKTFQLLASSCHGNQGER